ncbi:hypothetical protein HC931_06770 [Candidatus Gracilibacteria bacterium]|nr:hypothetical protein [Candidatus Gracilibacteria bacterium]NJP18069.1 hypothetical protein [Hydrococcus sp. CRU_1_1]
MSKNRFSLIFISSIFWLFPYLFWGTILPLRSLHIQPYENFSKPLTKPNIQFIQTINNQIILNEQLQKELSVAIARAQIELEQLANRFTLNFVEEIGMVYFHKGQSNWSIKFTFGGIVLQTSEEILVSTEQLFALKANFANTKLIKIKEKKYKTTGQMRQLGPILHERL